MLDDILIERRVCEQSDSLQKTTANISRSSEAGGGCTLRLLCLMKASASGREKIDCKISGG
jgi:hypothetical protein